MKNSIVCKVVIMLSAFLLFSGIFGCSGNNEYTVDDIVFIHAAYYATESNPVYSFALRKEKACWLFSADCRVGNQKERYASFDSGKGKDFEDGKLSLEDLVAYAKEHGEPAQISGKQELYETIVALNCK